MRGLWDRVAGKHAAIKQRNEVETLQAFQRDRTEQDELIFEQLEQRKLLHKQILETRRTTGHQRSATSMNWSAKRL